MLFYAVEKSLRTLLLLVLSIVFLNQESGSKLPSSVIEELFNNKYNPTIGADERLSIVSLLAEDQTRSSVSLLVKALDVSYSIIQTKEESLLKMAEELFRLQQNKKLNAYRLEPPTFSYEYTFQELLKEKNVIEKIRKALSYTKDPSILTWLTAHASKNMKTSFQRMMVLEILAEKGIKDINKVIINILGSEKYQFRVCAVYALRTLKNSESLVAIINALGDKQWQVRLAAISVLRKWKEWESVGPLVEALSQEKGRLRESIAIALSRITGKTFGVNHQAWKEWLSTKSARKTRSETFTMPSKPYVYAKYYGIPTKSNKIIFIIDCSTSMNSEWLKPREGRTHEPKRSRVVTTNIEAAKKELCKFIKNYRNDGYFNIVAYGTNAREWKKGMAKATLDNKKSSYKFIESLIPATLTNIYGALEMAFSIAGNGAKSRNKKVKADTLFLLSDGYPTTGITKDTNKILKAIRKWNCLKRIKINTIGMKSCNEKFLEQLALENGGKFTRTSW